MTSKVARPTFSKQEVQAIREGIDGVKHAIPPRFYTDEAIYQYEVEHVLKLNWLFVGRWDEAENPGDYFTIRIWDQSIIIVRDREKQLNALVNVCQHRRAQVVDDGSGNTNTFMCPYHRWTYALDGKLKGIAVQDIPGFDKKKCGLPTLRVEEWQGFIFINYDKDAKPLGPQLEGLNRIFHKFELGTYRKKDEARYKATWNYKCAIENGYEGYHHVGIHHDRIYHLIPSANTKPMFFGEIFGSYYMWPAEDMAEEMKQELLQPFGRPPWMVEGDDEGARECFVCIYPAGPMMYVNNYQCSYLQTHHEGVDSNRGTSGQAFAPWALDSPGAEEKVGFYTQMMKDIQDEDTYGCEMLQKGLKAAGNGARGGVLHPLEEQLNHYHNWYLDQMTKK